MKMIRPNSPEWAEQVQRAKGIIEKTCDDTWTEQRIINLISNCCQRVPLKYIKQLATEAKESS